MKYFLLTFTFAVALFLATISKAEVCTTSVEPAVTKEVSVESPIPQGLEGATITVKATDGKEYTFPIGLYKVVPRQQIQTVEVSGPTTTKLCRVEANEKKNNLSLGVRNDYTGISKSVSPGRATLKKDEGVVIDVEYYRRNLLLDAIGLGVGIDTNGTPKAKVGVDF